MSPNEIVQLESDIRLWADFLAERQINIILTEPRKQALARLLDACESFLAQVEASRDDA